MEKYKTIHENKNDLNQFFDNKPTILKEDKIINDYLNPILGELMQQSLTSILDMKNQNILSKDTKDEILFIAKFIDDAEQYYTSVKDVRNLAILSDLKQYILNLTT